MTHDEVMKSSGAGSRRLVLMRALMLGVLSSGLLCAFIPAAVADKLSCLPPHRLSESPTPAPANKTIGVSVAYLKVPFYANFKTGLEDGAKQFGFTYDLRRRQQRRHRDRARQPPEFHRAEEGPHPSDAVGRRESSPASSRSTTRRSP